MKLNQLADNAGARKGRMRVGRGIGSGKGKTAGRGGKGQTARSGVAIKGFEGGQMPLHRRIPKRGFNKPFRKEFRVLNLGQLQKAIEDGRLDPAKRLDPAVLVEAGLFKTARDGIRLLAKGELKTKIEIAVDGASAAAKAAVEQLGGTVVLPTVKEAAAG